MSSASNVGQNIQRQRELARMSREGLADRAGVSLRTVERIERGEVEPRRATLRVITDVLGVTADELDEVAA